MRNSGQPGRVMASVEAQFAPWAQVHEDLAVMAWRSVKRLTPATAAQEPQAIAEMIEHLRGLQREEGNG